MSFDVKAIQRVEQHGASDDIERARHFSWFRAIHSSTASPSAGDRPGLVSRSTAA
jgi:hypothetical protein